MVENKNKDYKPQVVDPISLIIQKLDKDCEEAKHKKREVQRLQ